MTGIEPSLTDLGTRLAAPVDHREQLHGHGHLGVDPGVTFSIVRQSSGAVDQDCTVPAGVDKGGCPNPGAAGDDW